MIRKANLFVVGAPKCGTTFLHKALSNHQDIFMSTPKEPLFFGTDLMIDDQHYPTESQYLQLFKDGQDKKYRGEAHVWNLFSKTAAKNIYDFNPDSKIIIMIRNPYEAAHSLFYQNSFSRVEPCNSFDEALDLEEKRKLGEEIPKNCFPGDRLLYTAVMSFSLQVKRYLEVFEKENLLIIFHSQLKADGAKTLNNVYEFLGLKAPTTPFPTRKVNMSKKNRISFVKDILESPPKLVSVVGRSVFTAKQRRYIYKRLIKLNSKAYKRPSLSKNTRLRLAKTFESDITSLEKLLGVNLDNWRNN